MSDTNYLTELGELQDMLKWLLKKDLLQELVELQELLNKSFVTKYNNLTSSRGNDCAWASRAKELFLQLQEKEISTKIKDLYFNYIERK